MKQTWNAEQYIDHASFVAVLGNPVLALLAPKPHEKILDLGCGDGALMGKLEEYGAIVHGVDASVSMIQKARKRGLSAEVCAGEMLNFNNQFDAVFSNAALHWMGDYRRVIEGVHVALKPGGRFVAEFGGHGCVNAIVTAMEEVFRQNKDFGHFENPWFFPFVNTYKAALEKGGFEVRSIELIQRPTPLMSGIKAWLNIFAKGIAKNLNANQLVLFLNETVTLLKPALYSEESGWVADYVRLRFSALKT